MSGRASAHLPHKNKKKPYLQRRPWAVDQKVVSSKGTRGYQRTG